MAGRRKHGSRRRSEEPLKKADDSKATVLRALDDLVGTGLASWSVSACGERRLRLANGDEFQLEATCVRRLR